MELEQGRGQAHGGVLQGLAGGIGPGDPTQKGLQGEGAAQLLQVSYKGEGAIGRALPAQPLAPLQLHGDRHRLAFAGKAEQIAPGFASQAEGTEGLVQDVDIAENGGQDRKMGHGLDGLRMPGEDENSQSEQAFQWPLPQPWPQPGSHHQGPLRLGVMASGAGSNFEALVRACRQGPLAAAVELLVVNRIDCGARGRAERLRVPTQLLDHQLYPSREDLDRALIAAFQAKGVDLVVMAGWMRIVTPVLIGAFPQRLVNIHPSLLPSFRGLDAVGQALAAGVSLSGCTAHLVAAEVDAGPILVQAAVPVLAVDTRASLAARIQVQEHRILPLAVALAAARLGTSGIEGQQR